jgi:serine/threonine protein kinase
LYLAASGSPPFAANTVAELIALHASEPPAPLNEVPWELARVIERLLAKDPAARFQTAGEARLAIETALEREAAVEAAVEAATPTVLSPATATILGWTTSPAHASSTTTAAAAASSSSSSVPRGSPSQAPSHNQPDDRKLHTSAPALFVPGGIAPRVRARPRTLRWIVLSAVVALAAALVAALAIVH